MPRKNNMKTPILCLLGSLSGFAIAGESFAPIHNEQLHSDAPEATSAHWCDALKTIGQIYKSPENPLIQDLKFFGRFQYQGAFVFGEDENGDDFSDSFDEFRRIRVGAKGKFLKYFDFTANINLVDDDRPQGDELDFGFQSFDTALSPSLTKPISLLRKFSLSNARPSPTLFSEASAPLAQSWPQRRTNGIIS